VGLKPSRPTLLGCGARRYATRRSADKDRVLTIEGQIIELLSRRRGRLFCADCIPLELHWPNPKDVSGAMHAIGMTRGFRVATGTCSRCGGEREGIKAG
jgi:hypothetical protein